MEKSSAESYGVFRGPYGSNKVFFKVTVCVFAHIKGFGYCAAAYIEISVIANAYSAAVANEDGAKNQSDICLTAFVFRLCIIVFIHKINQLLFGIRGY